MADEPNAAEQSILMMRQAVLANAQQVGGILSSADYQTVTGTVPGLGDMDDLSAVPGTSGYYRKLAASSRPAPDPTPSQLQIVAANGQSLGVGGQANTMQTASMGVNAPEPSNKRVAIYVGRGDDFVVAVEEAPEWDAVDQWKLAPGILLALVPILRALGVKLSDKSGGEFRALEKTGELG